MLETPAFLSWLSLGSNLGERQDNLREALEKLSSSGEIEVLRVSSLYETKPVGYTDQPDFLNLVAEIATTLEPHALLRRCLEVENEMGRMREERWGPRLIDLDVLLYGDLVIDNEELVLPHPLMLERAFVLVPLLELAPELAMPDGRRIVGSLEELPGEDMAGVIKTGDAISLPAASKRKERA
jgi:2-amino-4-hydroxy-6-hydroxymethyldihydropteridine diphosphokinase